MKPNMSCKVTVHIFLGYLTVTKHYHPLRYLCNLYIVCNHYKGCTFIMKLSEKFNYNLFICIIKVSCRFICQYNLRLINQRSGYTYTLLFTT